MLRSGLRRGIAISRKVHGFSRAARDVLPASDATLSELTNGVRVVSVTNSKPTTTLGVWVDSGSRYEAEGKNGVSQALEQLLYKGTAKRSAKQLQQELAKYGARLSSYTTRDHTAYFVQVENKDVEPVAEILADVLRNSKFNDGDVEAAKQVLLKQLDEVETQYEEVAWDSLHLTAYQGTPFAQSPFGNTESLTRQDVIDFADDHYKADRVVVTAVGGVPHGLVESFAKKNFGDLSNEYKRVVPGPLGTRFTGSEFCYRDDNIPYLYLAYAVEGVPASHPDALPLKLATQLVGQWDVTHGVDINSPIRAVQQISQIQGLKSYEPFSVNYADTGLFGVRLTVAGDSQDDAFDAFRAVQRQWKHLSTGVTEEEVDRAKNQLRTVLFGQLEDNLSVAQLVATQTLYTGEPADLSGINESIRKLSAGSVREAVSRHVYDRDLAVAGIGKTEAIPNYIQTRYGQSWWRL